MTDEFEVTRLRYSEQKYRNTTYHLAAQNRRLKLVFLLETFMFIVLFIYLIKTRGI